MDDIDFAFNRALELIKVSELLYNNKHYVDSINRSYYAVFYAAKALLSKKEIESRKHEGVISMFGKEYVLNNDFDPSISKILKELFEERGDADYAVTVKYDEEEASDF